MRLGELAYEGADWMAAIYINIVVWLEHHIWLYGASEQKVGWVEWIGDTPYTVMTTKAPAVLIILT